jgi:hypothetical protein
MALNHYELDGCTPYGIDMGSTPDISSLLDYDFYETVWYYGIIGTFPEPKWNMARCLGEATTVGQAMCYFFILPPYWHTYSVQHCTTNLMRRAKL